MIRIWLLIFVLALSINLSAQERYQSDWFDEIEVETFTYATKNGENLEMDIYLPKEDTETQRPLLIYVHGGGFSGGSRDHELVKTFCRRMANYGYVAASISYRLTRKNTPEGFGCDCPASEKLNTFNAAVEDLQDAAFFLIENREQFGAYQPPYCYGLDSGPVSFAGVIGMAGAIPDTTVIYDESAIPSLFFHGTDDALVPYATASHRYCSKDQPGYLILNGSKVIAEKLHQLNVPYWLYSVCGGGHELASTPMNDYFDVIIEFCYTFVVKGEGDERHTIIKGKQNTEKYSSYNYCNQ